METSFLERFPLAVRLVVVTISVALFFTTLATVLELVETSRLLFALWVLVIALALFFAVFRAKSLIGDFLTKASRLGYTQGGFEESCRALALDFKGRKTEEASRELSKIIGERARRTTAKYALVTGLSGTLSATVLAVLGDPDVVGQEHLVLKKLLPSAIPGLKVIDDSEVCASLAEAFRKLSLNFVTPLVYSPLSFSPCLNGESSIVFGELLDFAGGEFRLSKDDLSKHVAVFGSTGTGKSTTLSRLAVVAKELGFSVLILDWTGEYSNLLTSVGANFDVLSPMKGQASLNPLEVVEDEETFVNIMSKALGLSGPQSYLLVKAVEGARPRNLKELEVKIEELLEESRWDREVKRALLRKVALLTRGSYTAFSKTSLPELTGIKVVRLNDIRGWIARRSYALFMLATLFFERERRSIADSSLVVVDEAHNVLSGEEQPFVEQLFAEARKYGLSLAVASQSPSSIPNGVLLNANTKIVHALKSARDKAVIADSMSLSQDYLEVLDKLEPGVALVQSPSCSRVVLVRVKL
ncbi:MAG: ATP-binding protein [Acidilobaceae archaeon]